MAAPAPPGLLVWLAAAIRRPSYAASQKKVDHFLHRLRFPIIYEGMYYDSLAQVISVQQLAESDLMSRCRCGISRKLHFPRLCQIELWDWFSRLGI
jgi:hypothetical protein